MVVMVVQNESLNDMFSFQVIKFNIINLLNLNKIDIGFSKCCKYIRSS